MALYAFCRTSDDLVDAADALRGDRLSARRMARASLDGWAALVNGDLGSGVRGRELDGAQAQNSTQNSPQSSALNPQSSEVAYAWADTRARHGIPGELADELLAGVRMDLSISRYETWDDLWLYCYRVASTVGLMSMYVMGAEAIAAIPYAVQLGVALQLTNILRDVSEDARVGRIYLPAEDMARFGYTDDMLMSGAINRHFMALMEFQVARARALYRSAMPGIALLPPDSRLAVTAAATVYRGILDKIIAARYDVFNHRAHLTTREKLRALPAIWWQARSLKKPV